MARLRVSLARSLLVCMVAMALASLFASRNSTLKLVDWLLSVLASFDGVAEFNAREPNYVSGNWAPVHVEHLNAECAMSGKLPSSLAGGVYVRTGPNSQCWPPSAKHHAFSGEAMLHRIHLDQHSAKYSNHWIRHPAFNESEVPGSPCPPSVGLGDMAMGGLALPRVLISRLRTHLAPSSVLPTPPTERMRPGGTAVIHHAGHLFAATELFQPFEISIELTAASGKWGEIVPRGFVDFEGMLSNQTAEGPFSDTLPFYGPFSAHPRIDPKTGELFFFAKNGIGGKPVPFVAFGKLSSEGKPLTHFQIPVGNPPPAFVHDMFLTPTYAIVIDSSLRTDPARLATGKGLYFWNASAPLRFGIIRRSATSAAEVLWVESSEAGHIWHAVSAWEEEADKLVLFAPVFGSYADEVPIHLPTEPPSFLTRFDIDLGTGSVTQRRISSQVVERPSVNPRVVAPTVVWLRSEGSSSREMGKEIVKFDLRTERVLGSFGCGSDCTFGEAIFVPRDGSGTDGAGDDGSSEDAGYLMDIVYRARDGASEYMVWDAQTMDREPLVRVTLPQRVPYGVHGLWLDQTVLQSLRPISNIAWPVGSESAA